MRATLTIFFLALGISSAAAQQQILPSDLDCVKTCKQKDQGVHTIRRASC